MIGGDFMNLQAYILNQEKLEARHKKKTANEKYIFYTMRQFIEYCLSYNIDAVENVDNRLWSNFVRHLSQKDTELTKYKKLCVIKKFLANNGGRFAPNPGRRHVSRTNKLKQKR